MNSGLTLYTGRDVYERDLANRGLLDRRARQCLCLTVGMFHLVLAWTWCRWTAPRTGGHALHCLTTTARKSHAVRCTVTTLKYTRLQLLKDRIDGITLINLRELLSIFLIELLETACICM